MLSIIFLASMIDIGFLVPVIVVIVLCVGLGFAFQIVSLDFR